MIPEVRQLTQSYWTPDMCMRMIEAHEAWMKTGNFHADVRKRFEQMAESTYNYLRFLNYFGFTVWWK